MRERALTVTGADPWLGRFLEQDRQALREVERLIARIVSSRAFGIPSSDRQDLVQECLMQIWEGVALPGFDRDRSFEAFVRTVASRRCLDWRRVRRLTVALPADLPSGAAGPDAAYSEAQRAALGRALLDGLGNGCREVIRLHAVENLSYAEISARLGRSEGALRKQMSDCLGRARTAWRRFSEAREAASLGAATGTGSTQRSR
jgi:RNA polymerase sigma factor (sigma-70 family)